MDKARELFLRHSVLKIPLSSKIKPEVDKVLSINRREFDGILDERMYAFYMMSNLINKKDFVDNYPVDDIIDFSFSEFYIDVKSTASWNGYSLEEAKIERAKNYLYRNALMKFVFVLVSRDRIEDNFYHLRVNEILIVDSFGKEEVIKNKDSKFAFNIKRGA